ncbi:MAG TPA: alpha/beta fold hydrolase [Solirubrobacteraceae bacterium]|nr:alpha/beta fold hydrolase [Solirubrobacteraceae bacterium]
MSRRALLPALACLLGAALPASTAWSQTSSRLSFVACAEAKSFTCATLAVPLDRAGSLPGAVPLSVERRLAGATPSTSAVLALAGGPGQAALPHAEDIAQAIKPALATHDLLVFDQRGTGASDPLSCSAFEEPAGSEAAAAEACALDIGPARRDFTTVESVNDIEALRQAAGYEKLVLYGTSYGTKVALEYAERFPTHVEALVLDSVVPSDGEEALHEASFEAVAPILEELCAGGACAGITTDPVADVATLNARLRRHSLRGTVYDGSGRRHVETLGELDLYDVMVAGDLNPALRALLPAAVQSALHNDPDPLLRLERLAEGLIPNVPAVGSPDASGEVDEALFATTICEETPFPWQRAAGAKARVAEALAFVHAQASSDFYPFDATTAFDASSMPGCARWPDAAPPPPATTALPNVPTLILSGAQDMRTPTAQARRVAAEIPDAQVVVVPYTGHSVIGSDLGNCAEHALAAFFAGSSVPACEPTQNLFAPTPVNPTRLSAVAPAKGVPGRAGRTLAAAIETIIDLNRQIIGATIQAEQNLPNGAGFGGLHGGYARLSATSVTLHSYSAVPGVTLTGALRLQNGTLAASSLRIGGSAASRGTVRLGSGFKRISGTLGGRHFSLAIAQSARAGAARRSSWLAPAPILARLQRAGIR